MNRLYNSKKLLVCSIFFLQSLLSLAQSSQLSLTIAVKNINKSDGLSESHINASFIDSKGNIRFLTNNTIGHFQENHVRNIEFTHSFSNKGFNDLKEDVQGNYWLSENFEWFYPFNIQRCVVYNPKTNVTVSVDKYIGTHLALHSIVSNSQGIIFLSTKTGEIYKFNSAKKTLTKITRLTNTPAKLLYAGSDELIACTEKSSKYDSQLFKIKTNGKIEIQQDVSGKFVKSVIRIKNRFFYTYEKGQFIGLSELGGKLERRFEVSKETYLAGITFNTNKKLFVLNKGNGLGFLNENLELIKSENYDFLIHHVAHDPHGNSFLSTNKGVFIIRLIEQKIKTFLKNPNPDKANDNYSCRAIIKTSNNEIVVNTNRKRQVINLQSGKIKTLSQSLHPSSPDNKFILSILKDTDGNLLFGEDILMKTDLKSGQNKILCTLDSTKIWSMENYQNGLLLGLEKKGILFYDNRNGSAKNFTIKDINLKNSIIYDFYVLNHNAVLVASEAGLYVLKNNTYFEAIRLPNAVENQISFFSIEDQSDHLILASSQGIWIFDKSSNILKAFVKETAFTKKKFLSAYQTNNGIWASSEEGVWHFNNQGILLKIFTEKDGLSSKECNRLAHFHDENDILYFGGVNGLNIINPQDFSDQKETTQFLLKIKEINAFRNRVITRGNLAQTQSNIIQLKRGENNLAIKFSYEDFKYDCTKKYYYRSSKSISKDWIPIIGQTLLLDYVAHGQTEIEVRVVSCDIFTDVETLRFIVNRPKAIYLEWYFTPTTILILGLLFWTFNKYTTYKLRLRNESLQRKINYQTRSLQDSLTLKETLLSLLVHDVRYPVQSFYDLSKKLAYLTQKNDQERLALLGKETEEKSRKVLWLIDELVYWVKSTNDKNEVVLQEKNIEDHILQILDIYEDELKAKNLHTVTHNINHYITTDYGLLIIVLRNLIYNAVVYSKPSSTISISINETQEKFILKIINQSEGNSRTLNNGLGIGLALLFPLLEKSDINLETGLEDNIFTATVEISNRL